MNTQTRKIFWAWGGRESVMFRHVTFCKNLHDLCGHVRKGWAGLVAHVCVSHFLSCTWSICFVCLPESFQNLTSHYGHCEKGCTYKEGKNKWGHNNEFVFSDRFVLRYSLLQKTTTQCVRIHSRRVVMCHHKTQILTWCVYASKEWTKPLSMSAPDRHVSIFVLIDM